MREEAQGDDNYSRAVGVFTKFSSYLFVFNLILVFLSFYVFGFCAISLLDKDALTSKSFAKIVRLKSKILLFSNKLVSKDQSVQTEE